MNNLVFVQILTFRPLHSIESLFDLSCAVLVIQFFSKSVKLGNVHSLTFFAPDFTSHSADRIGWLRKLLHSHLLILFSKELFLYLQNMYIIL